MITIALETISYGQEPRDFLLILNTFEEALDAINLIAKNCSSIEEAYLIENGKWLKLPIEIFDGKSFSGPIAELEEEWLQLLNVIED